ncbi:prion-like protein doppel [Sceloporus undulatus]|uniref:prion-like protein doppel n=1 Tax=Sceloporus undulatus TaxID=8520 RepID=UPI001C4C32C3|nr:prion-like protein doppel [Sceloporus undulatus]
MQRNLIGAVLFVALWSEVCLCRRVSGSTNKRNKKTSTTTSAPKLRSPTVAMTVQGNLCHGGQMIDNMELDPNDQGYYKANLKVFPDGLYYANCSLPLQLNTTKEDLIGECVNFTIASNKLNLPNGKDSSDPKERVMWVLINYLCANESCSEPCPLLPNIGNLHYFDQVLVVALISCSILSAK